MQGDEILLIWRYFIGHLNDQSIVSFPKITESHVTHARCRHKLDADAFMTHAELVAGAIRSGAVAVISLLYTGIRDYGRRRGSTRKRIANALTQIVLRRWPRKVFKQANAGAFLQRVLSHRRVK